MYADVMPQAIQRIAVVGTSGAGKTTTARLIAERLELRHVELDALHWDAHWTMVPLPVFRERVARALAGDAWVADGNYGKARDLVWPPAQLIVWLDYGLPVIFWRLFRRSLRRSLSHEELWNGNRERLRDQFFSRDSLFLWALQTNRRHRAEYVALLGRPEHAHLKLVRLQSPAATRVWLARLPEISNVIQPQSETLL
jgi:adenylate kinase family enzyme